MSIIRELSIESTPNGLINLGNTCFLNTAIQCIAQILGDYFISGEYWSDVSVISTKDLGILCEDKLGDLEEYLKNTLGVEVTRENIHKVAVEEFCKIFCRLMMCIQNDNGRWSRRHIYKYLENFWEMLPFFNKSWQFTDHQQHDSNDFLVFLIELLGMCMSYDVSIKIKDSEGKIFTKEIEDRLSDIDKRRLSAYRSWQNEWSVKGKGEEKRGVKTPKYRISTIANRMAGQFRTLMVCANPECDYQSERFDMFFSVALDVNQCRNVYDCFNSYINIEELDEENKWLCDKCKTKTCAKKCTSIWKTADNIIVHFKRFQHVKTPMGYTLTKDSHGIEYPIEGLDMSPYVEEKNKDGEIFDLSAISLHFGELRGGHYECLRKINGNWWLFNDSKVIKVSEDKVIDSSAYYLVYTRRI